MERSEFARTENWDGSYYELCLELGPVGNDALATRALEALWRRPELHGPWLQRADVEAGAKPVVPSVREANYYGWLTLPDGNEVGCASYLIRIDGESDWLDLSIPTGMLELRYALSYPLDRSSNPWQVQVDGLLARIGGAIYEEASFQLGLIGEEASGVNSASNLTKEDCERGGLLVPLPLWRKLAPKREPSIVTNDLVHAPFMGPHITFGG
jgi:hypothetical protein